MKKNFDKAGYSHYTYLIGAMMVTHEGDFGEMSREKLYEELLLRNVYPFNPAKNETLKTDMPTEKLVEEMKKWTSQGNREMIKLYCDKIWRGVDRIDHTGSLIHIPGDFDYVTMSDWITMTLKEKDRPCGTFGEACDAYKRKIPIYLITKLAQKDIPNSLFGWICASDGDIFPSVNKYLEFIDKKYNLKRKDNEKEKK